MIRKQIYLTPDLERLIQLTASAEKKPAAAVIRERLIAGFAQLRQTPGEETGLVGLATHARKGGPADASLHLDDYLYGRTR